MKGKSGCEIGCIIYEFSWREKTLDLKEAHAGCYELKHIHTRAALLVGHVHTRAALLTSHVPVDRLVSIED